MFTLRDFVKKGLLDAVGKMPDYQIILNSAGWLDKGVLTEEDLFEIDSSIQSRHAVVNEAPEEATDLLEEIE